MDGVCNDENEEDEINNSDIVNISKNSTKHKNSFNVENEVKEIVFDLNSTKMILTLDDLERELERIV